MRTICFLVGIAVSISCARRADRVAARSAQLDGVVAGREEHPEERIVTPVDRDAQVEVVAIHLEGAAAFGGEEEGNPRVDCPEAAEVWHRHGEPVRRSHLLRSHVPCGAGDAVEIGAAWNVRAQEVAAAYGLT